MSRHHHKFWIICASLLATTSLWGQAAAPSKPAPSAPDRPAAPARERDDTADLSAALERARSFYQAGAYDQCVAAYGDLLSKDRQRQLEAELPNALEQARIHFAACLLALGDVKQADRQLRKALSANPLMASPDPVLFPPQVRDLFFKVKGDFLEEIRLAQDQKMRDAQRMADERERAARAEQQRIARLEQLASLETVVSKNKRWVAAIPFGVGQFQNGDTGLGVLFLATETVLFGTSLIAASTELGLHSEAEGGRKALDYGSLNNNLEIARSLPVLAGASWLLVAGVGILEAQLNFVEELPVGQRPRRMPSDTLGKNKKEARGASHLKLEPGLSLGRETVFSVRGRF